MTARALPLTDAVYRANADSPAIYPAGVEGQSMGGEVFLKVMMSSAEMLMLEVFREKGVKDPVHRHDDHETSCYLVKGRLRVTIGEDSFIAEPGDVWFHPKGVDHTSEALEDSVQVEVKSPPRKTWVARGEQN